MSERRVVVDTNIVISALLSPFAIPARAYEKAVQAYVLITSTQIIEELIATLVKKKFDKYADLERRKAFVEQYRKSSVIIEPTETITVCRDPKDNKFLELAVSGNAACIITGDQDLLELHPFREIPILTPTIFLETTFA